MIEINELTFSYPSHSGTEIPVINKLNLFIPRGRYVSLMGPNGSGKTTLGKLIKGLISPQEGSIRIAGELLHPGEISPRVGYIFSNPENQIVCAVVEEDVAFGLENMGLDRETIAERVERGLALVGMQDYRCAAPHHLSGGQQQKVVLAGTLAMDCEILILDEPTSMLDLRDQEEILNLLAQIHGQEKKTILHITHSFSAALRAQDFIYLEKGQVLFYGSWEEFWHKAFVSNSLKLTYPPLWELLRKLGAEGWAIPSCLHSPAEAKKYLIEVFSRSPAD
ncbi:MAG: ATP-binding cassette domain-containing protein [bacterium]